MPASKFNLAAGGGVGVLIDRILSIYDEDGFFLCSLSDEDDDRCVCFDLLLELLLLELLLLRLESDELVDRRCRRLRCDGERESRFLCLELELLYFDEDLYRAIDESDELSERCRYFDDFRSDERCRFFLVCFERDDDRRRDLFRDGVRVRDRPIFLQFIFHKLTSSDLTGSSIESSLLCTQSVYDIYTQLVNWFTAITNTCVVSPHQHNRTSVSHQNINVCEAAVLKICQNHCRLNCILKMLQ